MKIAVLCSHVGSNGIKPSGQHGGGELHTFAFLQLLNRYYDTTAIIPNGYYPSFESASDYGLDLSDIRWRPVGDRLDWVRQFDVQMSINHSMLPPALCRRNVLTVFFPQRPEWDVSGYDTIIANSEYTARWIKSYWGREADVVYPPVPVVDIHEKTKDTPKENIILCIGRFFQVPDGNNKNHLVVLKAFQRMMLPEWQLHFVGAIQNERYYTTIRRAVGDDQRVHFHHDITRDEYVNLLGRAKFVWAATGYGADKPASREHFGIFPVEAMAAGAIPVVHNSGGTPETGCETWEDPAELIAITKSIINEPDEVRKLSKAMRMLAKPFGLEEQGRKLIEIIEKPIVLEHHVQKSKIWVGPPPLDQTKVAIMSDAPITTGFGILTYMVGSGLREMGYNVVCWGMQDPHDGRPRYEDPFPVWRGCIHDPSGWHVLRHFLEFEKPDILYLNYDTGNIRLMIDKMRDVGIDLPMVAYVPIEGKPVVDQFIETLRLIRVLNGEPILYTRWAVEAVKEAGGPFCDYVWHGADHAAFRPLPAEDVQQFRAAVGWHNKFVCIYVGRNKRTKGFGALLEAARILKTEGHNDIVWYLHTNVNESMQHSSLPLLAKAHDMEIDDVVCFAPDLDDQTKGIPYDEPALTGNVPDTDDIHEVHKYNLMTLSMIERYSLARYGCFVNASEVEGFGLPSLEAMGCGLPVVSVDDNGVQKEVLGDAPLYVPVSHWDDWHTGAKLAQVNPQNLAKAILEVKENEQLREEMAQASLEHYQQFKWANVVQRIHKAIQDRIQ